ncbi:MAG: 6,7-dimethyl-8-ribityllumazine synthase [Weeksellaceae bacterium]|nr:6,7-dimethyl-8-ribityllumazine synthase [Weeksellaceae bacterium]
MSTKDKNLSHFDKHNLPDAGTFRFGIVVSQWNSHITHNLLKGAVDTLLELGARPDRINCFDVPGSFELIHGANQLCKGEIFNAVIVIGSVIRGETAHFDYICQGVTEGIKDLNIKYNTPVIFCVLTDDNEQQALDRSGGKYGNKGVEAAVAAVQMANFGNH